VEMMEGKRWDGRCRVLAEFGASSGTEWVYPGSRKKGTTSLLFWYVDLSFVSAVL
jgi:hypothetical protein